MLSQEKNEKKRKDAGIRSYYQTYTDNRDNIRRIYNTKSSWSNITKCHH